MKRPDFHPSPHQQNLLNFRNARIDLLVGLFFTLH